MVGQFPSLYFITICMMIIFLKNQRLPPQNLTDSLCWSKNALIGELDKCLWDQSHPFRPSLLGDGFAPSWIHPDKVMFKREIIWDFWIRTVLNSPTDKESERGAIKKRANIIFQNTVVGYEKQLELHPLTLHLYG